MSKYENRMLMYVLALSEHFTLSFCSRQGAKSRGLQARAPSGRQTPVYLNPKLELCKIRFRIKSFR